MVKPIESGRGSIPPYAPMSQSGVPAEVRSRSRRLPGQSARALAAIRRIGAGLVRDIKSCAFAGGCVGAAGSERVYARGRERVARAYNKTRARIGPTRFGETITTRR